MEKLFWLGPPVGFKLPLLTGGHYTDDAIPSVGSKLCQRINPVHCKVLDPCFNLLAARVDVRFPSVDWNHVLCFPAIPLPCYLGGLVL